MIPPDLEDAIHDRYRDRPDTLTAVLADAEAWERLKTFAPPTPTEGVAHAAPGDS